MEQNYSISVFSFAFNWLLFVQHSSVQCPSSLPVYWISIADHCSWEVLSVRSLQKEFLPLKAQNETTSTSPGEQTALGGPDLPTLNIVSLRLITEVIRYLSGRIICIDGRQITWRS